MADEILYAGLADLRTAEVLSGTLLMLLADRNALPNHPALVYLGDAHGRGSLATKVSLIGLDGYNIPGATSGTEGVAPANTALTDSSVVCTPVIKEKMYTVGDIARWTSSLGELEPEMFMRDAMLWTSLELTYMIANLMDNFATVVGTTGVNATVANVIDSITALKINNAGPGPYMGVLHSRQLGDIRLELATAVGGTMQWDAPTAAMVAARGGAFQGSWLGVDFFESNAVPTMNAGADRGGGIFARGAIGWCDMSFGSSGRQDQLLLGTRSLSFPNGTVRTVGDVLIEELRSTTGAGTTSYLSKRVIGVTEVIDLAGVTLQTDA